MPFKMQRVYMLFRQENQERVTNELKHIQNKESDIPSLLNFPDLKIPQVPELYDMFGFCQDNSTFPKPEIWNQYLRLIQFPRLEDTTGF